METGTPKFKLGDRVIIAKRIPTCVIRDGEGGIEEYFGHDVYIGIVFYVAGVSTPSPNSGWSMKYRLSKDPYGIDIISWFEEQELGLEWKTQTP
jgi:hypothetical protein